jgi:hypothetical protein
LEGFQLSKVSEGGGEQKTKKEKEKKGKISRIVYIFGFIVQPKLEKDDKGDDLLLGIRVKNF